jgi:hypothetical protein
MACKPTLLENALSLRFACSRSSTLTGYSIGCDRWPKYGPSGVEVPYKGRSVRVDVSDIVGLRAPADPGDSNSDTALHGQCLRLEIKDEAQKRTYVFSSVRASIPQYPVWPRRASRASRWHLAPLAFWSNP